MVDAAGAVGGVLFWWKQSHEGRHSLWETWVRRKLEKNMPDTLVEQVKHEVKQRLTLSATGTEGGEGPRNHIQVLANSFVATVLTVAHASVLGRTGNRDSSCFSLGRNASDILIVGIVA